jgi:hypothetical protein
MAASRNDIAEWFKRGVERESTHMIVVCDTFDHSDYPVFVSSEQNVREEFEKYNGKNMQRVMEVYKLSDDMEGQLNEGRAFHW